MQAEFDISISALQHIKRSQLAGTRALFKQSQSAIINEEILEFSQHQLI